jgi:uncharacterized protein (DUF1684 family)
MNLRPLTPRRLAPALLCWAAPLALGAAAAAPLGAPPPDPAAYQKEVETWRAHRIASLKRQDGWLSDVGRFRLEEGENLVGSDPSSQVVLPAGKAPAFAGTLVRHGDAVKFLPAPGTATLTAEHHRMGDHGQIDPAPAGAPVVGPLALSDDNAEEGPTVVHVGSISFYVIRRFDKLLVRVKDAQAPAIAAFQGIDDFPVSLDWRVVARYEPYNPPKPVTITNVLGETEEAGAAGAVVFQHGGQTLRIDAFEESGGRLFIIFGDQTNAFETYGAGRFIDTDQAPKDGRVVVDFNKAFNPPCALSAHAVCPLPPKQNRLPLQVKAGEKTYHAG